MDCKRRLLEHESVDPTHADAFVGVSHQCEVAVLSDRAGLAEIKTNISFDALVDHRERAVHPSGSALEHHGLDTELPEIVPHTTGIDERDEHVFNFKTIGVIKYGPLAHVRDRLLARCNETMLCQAMLVHRADGVGLETRLFIQVYDPILFARAELRVEGREMHGARLELPTVGALVCARHDCLLNWHPWAALRERQGTIGDYFKAPDALGEPTRDQRAMRHFDVAFNQRWVESSRAITEDHDNVVGRTRSCLLVSAGNRCPEDRRKYKPSGNVDKGGHRRKKQYGPSHRHDQHV
mmetsp:Transcript_40016/g.110182  ORF Transcript_40016/g.110182 Transcript_40016/m.110182 type:complete len:295 (-) Transcript_40016:905-1789(-)